MYQYDDPTVVASMPTPAAAGTPGYFTDGNPAGGVAATILRADFMNALMEEILNVLNAASITPSKTDNTQLLAAIGDLTSGRLINVQTFTSSGTYTPSSGTKKILVKGTGAGGSGGGTAATSSGQAAAAAGGSCGAYGEALYTSGFTPSVAVTIGSAGAGAAAGNNPGNAGQATSFGALLILPGGTAGAGCAAITGAGGGGSNGTNSADPTGANIVGYGGQAGGNGQIFSAGPQAGNGGSGPLGTGGWAPTGNGARSGTGYGAGSSGANAQASQAAQGSNAGQPGILIVYEYA